MAKPDVIIYTASYCGYCRAAKRLLQENGVSFTEIDVTVDFAKRRWLAGETGSRTVPQIFWNGRPVGGYTDLCRRLPELLKET